MSGSSYLTTASCIVFVGNIPYGLCETQITDIFSSVGRVICFRMVFDRDTGRSKGYGFAEYIDAETAASAVRNLDNYEIMGRKLRVDYSSQGYVGKELGFSKEGLFSQITYGKDGYVPKKDQAYGDDRTTTTFNDAGHHNPIMGSESGHSCHSSRYEVPISAPGTAAGVVKGMMNTNVSHAKGSSSKGASSLLPVLPPGIDNHPGLTTPDSISKTLAAVPVPQLLGALIQLKELATSDPAKTIELLRQAPQMSYAIFQSLIMMNLVEPSVLAQLLEPNNTAAMYNQAQASITTHLRDNPHQPASMNPAVTAVMSAHIQHQVAPIHASKSTPVVGMQQVPPLGAQAPYYGYPPAGHRGGQEIFAAQVAAQVAHQQQQHQQQQHHHLQQQAQMQAMQAMKEPENAALLQRVMVLSQEEISRLPAEQQQHILMLKHRLMTEGMGGGQLHRY